ncbi:MAG: photosynthetic reaction center cytochrome c subunit [Acidobacteriia bacterium]|nr:photosynthetic reaction center cytochrome c subunit [Terriglobia bacterium]
MKLRSTRLILAVAAMTAVWLVCVTAPQAVAQAPKAPMAEQVFKNVQALKGITVDDFLGTMGVMSAAVGYDCSECHIGAGTDTVDWAADNPKKNTARRMVLMVNAINRDNFSGRRMVSCYTCHHGRDRPSTTPTMDAVYGPGSSEMDDILVQMPGQPPAEKIIDKYLQALGGAQKLAAIKSYVATGTSVGFGGFGGGGKVHIYAKYPDHRTTLIEFEAATGRGESIRTYNGQTGWIKTPLTVLGQYETYGGELAGAKVDAQMSFPVQIKQVLTNLRVSLPTSISDLPGPSAQTAGQTAEGIGKDRVVNVVQGTEGTGVNSTYVTMYLDQESGLLLRMVRYAPSPIGRVPTQMDFADYRSVNGVKMPFRLTFAWLDGRDAIQLNDIKVNVPIDEKMFGTPEQVKGK